MDATTLADDLAAAATTPLDEIPPEVAEAIARRVVSDDRQTVDVARFGSSI